VHHLVCGGQGEFESVLEGVIEDVLDFFQFWVILDQEVNVSSDVGPDEGVDQFVVPSQFSGVLPGSCSSG